MVNWSFAFSSLFLFSELTREIPPSEYVENSILWGNPIHDKKARIAIRLVWKGTHGSSSEWGLSNPPPRMEPNGYLGPHTHVPCGTGTHTHPTHPFQQSGFCWSPLGASRNFWLFFWLAVFCPLQTIGTGHFIAREAGEQKITVFWGALRAVMVG